MAFFVNWHYSTFLYQSKQQMVLNAIRFFFSCLIASLATILINFQQKFALVRSFHHFAIKFVNFLARLKSASRSSLSWREKCDAFLLELFFAIAQSNLARKNDVMNFARLYIHVQK